MASDIVATAREKRALLWRAVRYLARERGMTKSTRNGYAAWVSVPRRMYRSSPNTAEIWSCPPRAWT